MTQSSARKLISDQVWQDLEAAVQAAKHSPAGAPAELIDREFLEALSISIARDVRGGIYRPSWVTGMPST